MSNINNNGLNRSNIAYDPMNGMVIRAVL